MESKSDSHLPATVFVQGVIQFNVSHDPTMYSVYHHLQKLIQFKSGILNQGGATPR